MNARKLGTPYLIVRALGTALVVLLAGCSEPGEQAASSALAAAGAVPTVVSERAGIAIETAQVSGLLFLPDAEAPQPAVLVIGGSEGGLKGSSRIARGLADGGLAALAIAYFGHPGLPDQLIELPLERFDRALDWLRADPRVRGDAIAILGASKGAEACLLVAAARVDIAAVVAAAPSHVVWQAIDPVNWAGRSSWTRAGSPLPYVGYDTQGPMWPLVEMYARSLGASARVETARIPVTRIGVPVLLVSGEADQLWPSFAMSESIVAAMKAAGNSRVTHLHYADAGHAAFGVPFDPLKADHAGITQLGGSVDGNLAARVDGWPRVIAFLRAALDATADPTVRAAIGPAGASR